MEFDWDRLKNAENVRKYNVSFYDAQTAFFDRKRVIAIDVKHSTAKEKRYFCFGKVKGKIVTVRFTLRGNRIRIFGAGYWREGRKKYEQKNKI